MDLCVPEVEAWLGLKILAEEVSGSRRRICSVIAAGSSSVFAVPPSWLLALPCSVCGLVAEKRPPSEGGGQGGVQWSCRWCIRRADLFPHVIDLMTEALG